MVITDNSSSSKNKGRRSPYIGVRYILRIEKVIIYNI